MTVTTWFVMFCRNVPLLLNWLDWSPPKVTFVGLFWFPTVHVLELFTTAPLVRLMFPPAQLTGPPASLNVVPLKLRFPLIVTCAPNPAMSVPPVKLMLLFS